MWNKSSQNEVRSEAGRENAVVAVILEWIFEDGNALEPKSVEGNNSRKEE